MSNGLGMHWLRYHADERDFAHIAQAGYASFKLFEWMWSDANFCRRLLEVARPDAIFLARDHPLSEQKEDLWRAPGWTGERHADAWAEKVTGGAFHLPIERTFFLGVNEPDATNGDRQAIDRYTAAFLNRLRRHGLRGGAFSFATGHPRTVDGTPHTAPDYTVFEASRQAIVAGGHFGVLHIYGTAAQSCVPGHFDRLRHCPWPDVLWVVGECGIDEHVVSGAAHLGYLAALASFEDFPQWLERLVRGTNDSRIHSWLPFSYDFSHPWDSFDVRPVRDGLAALRLETAEQPDDEPQRVFLPVIENGEKATDKFERALAFVLRWEGGWADNPADPGGATMRGITLATYTRWCEAHGRPPPTKVELAAISENEVRQIYYEWYWLESGADRLPWPDCLAVFDVAVNGGPGRARQFVNEVGTDAVALTARRLRWYTNIDGWETFGRGWTRRCVDLLLEVGKE